MNLHSRAYAHTTATSISVSALTTARFISCPFYLVPGNATVASKHIHQHPCTRGLSFYPDSFSLADYAYAKGSHKACDTFPKYVRQPRRRRINYLSRKLGSKSSISWNTLLRDEYLSSYRKTVEAGPGPLCGESGIDDNTKTPCLIIPLLTRSSSYIATKRFNSILTCHTTRALTVT
jgi:hypothetical protein